MKVKLHYVGKGLYTKEAFVREAKTYGVSRAMPISVLKTFKPGEKILLAHFEPGENGRGTAKVFGYFVYSGVGVWDSKVLRELTKYVKPMDVRFIEKHVNRICGSYVLVAEYYFDAMMCEVLYLIEEISKELGEKVKVFACGEYRDLPEFEIEDVPFSRSVIEVEVPDVLLDEDVEDFLLRVWKLEAIEDYQQRKYLPKKARNAIPLTAF